MKEALAEKLYSIGCVKIGEFKLTSGLTSPIYVDLRILPSYPREFKWIIGKVIEVLKGVNFDVVCGLAVGGIPLATAVAYELEKPLIYVRKKAKEHGTMRLIEGVFEKGMKAIIVDDVATTGSTLIRGVKALQGNGIDVEAALVIVDREQGAGEALKQLKVPLIRLSTLRELLEDLFNKGYISYETFLKVKNYLEGVCGHA